MTARDLFEQTLKKALELEYPYHGRPQFIDSPSDTLQPAAVMPVFGFSRDNKDSFPQLLITQRTMQVTTHKGQMAFPGGVSDTDNNEKIIDTALRETEEEVGIKREGIRVIGKLPMLRTPTGFMITPVVGISIYCIEEIELHPNPDEIQTAFWVPLNTLLQPEIYKSDWVHSGNIHIPTHVYQIDQYRIWGATAAIINNLLERLKTAGYRGC